MPDRYHRQTLLEDFGDAGQARLTGAHAFIVGCGALGCTAADLLARAGIGRLTIIDRDLVEETNLQRQVLFDQRHADDQTPKAHAAAGRIGEINPGVRVHPLLADFAPAIAERALLEGPLGRPDVLIDGTDNFETRFLVNDLAVKHGLPYVYAGAVATHAMAMTVLPGETPCLRCLFAGPPPAGSQPTCDTVGVLGPVIAMVSGIQAVEAIKLLVGRRDLIRRTLLEFDPWSNTRRELDLSGLRDPACPCCAGRRFDCLDNPAGEPVSLCGRNAIQINPTPRTLIVLADLAERLAHHGSFTATRYLLQGELTRERSDSGPPIGLTVFSDGRAIVRGLTDPARARSIYAKYIGS
ncbi:MAG: ThiF family adenylyltransferase [Phycisphaerales bacterium]|nr:ThiF family adenylyltransferase [Phycisphaerales bacterium]